MINLVEVERKLREARSERNRESIAEHTYALRIQKSIVRQANLDGEIDHLENQLDVGKAKS